MTRLELYELFQRIPGVIAKDNDWFATRCVLCGDSQKSLTKRRLYINFSPTDTTQPIGYKCFNCSAHGLLTGTMLRQIGLDDDEAVAALNEINSKAMQTSGEQKKIRWKGNRSISLEIPLPRKEKTDLLKVKYVFDRIGTKIPFTDFPKLKIVWNLTELLKTNNLPINSAWKNHIDMLNRDYVGFLSVQNEYIIFRDITNQNEYRYIKYGIIRGRRDALSYYSIEHRVSALETEPVELIVAEGPFDVISLLYNVYDGDTTRRVFIGLGEGEFEFPILYHINKGLVGSNVTISCYVDNDTIYNYKELIDKVTPFVGKIRFYHNTKSKDFGVPKDQIEVEPFDIRIAEYNRRNNGRRVG